MILLALACNGPCEEGAVDVDGICMPDVSLRGTPYDTGSPDTGPVPIDDTGETGDTGPSPIDDLDGDGASDDEDCDDDDPTVYPGAEEFCDYMDNDCDGVVDEDAPSGSTAWYVDADGDGYGDPDATQMSCFGIFGYVDNDRDCDDTDPGAWPNAIERCNDADDDCDGVVDEPDAADVATWYADADGDGYGDAAAPTLACAAPPGTSFLSTDCDDGEPGVNPGAVEIARDGQDNDCDGTSNGYGIDGERDLGASDAIFHGAGAGEYAGYALTTGDLDADGADDLVVGAPFSSTFAPGAGAVALFPVADVGTYTLDDAGVSRAGTGSYDGVGTAVVVADFDGDDGLDLVIGAPGDDSGETDAGAVWLLPGPLTGTAALSGTPVPGDLAAMGLGAVLAAGDLDGDGDEELLAGAPDADVDGADAGAAWRVDGDGTVYAWNGETAGDLAGAALAVGDIDGDGLADVLIGAPGADTSGGAVYVLLDQNATLSAADYVLVGDAVGDAAGSALAIADCDADGRLDLLVGVPGAADVVPEGGAVHLVTAVGGGALSSVSTWSIYGELAGAHLGASIAAGGDLDGDDVVDLLVGAPESDAVARDAGEAYVVFGPIPSASELGGYLRGESAASGAGWKVGFAWDPFGDGYDDALVGAYGYDFGGFAAGAVYRTRGGSW